MASSKLENRNIRPEPSILGVRVYSYWKIKKGKRWGETKRVRINCTVRPNCPGRINTGVQARRGWWSHHGEFLSDNQFPHRDLSVGGVTAAGSFGLPRFMRAPYDARPWSLARKIIFRLLSIIARRAPRPCPILVLLFVGPTSRGNWHGEHFGTKSSCRFRLSLSAMIRRMNR